MLKYKQYPKGDGGHTPPAEQVPTLYGNPALNSGSPMKMAALTMFTAEEDRRTAVLVIPWFGTPPPQSAASMISPPYDINRVRAAVIEAYISIQA
jgi:hypothetical protein